MGSVAAPQITGSVNQNFFIEALQGAQNPVSYLDRFPDSVYTKAIDSVLVTFMYALLGPVGVGQLKQEYLEARLQIEQAGLSTVDLDNLYSNAFAFARLAEETYNLDADASLLPAAQRAQILAQDASFRNRAIDFLKGARAGGTHLGIALAARSGLNRPVEVIENYRQLYDRYTDAPLSLPNFGSTVSDREVIIIPRQLTPQSSVQTLSISGEPQKGYFTLTFPRDMNWNAMPVSTTAGSSLISVANINQLPSGVFVTLTNLPTNSTNLNTASAGWNHATLFAMAGQVAYSTSGPASSISLIYPPSAGSLAGQAALAPSTGNFIALVGSAQTVLIAYNASAADVQNALQALPVIGAGNVLCTGGPLPDQPIQIQFAGQLSDQEVPLLVVNEAPDAAVGITQTGSGGTEEMADVNNSPLTIFADIVQTTAGRSVDGQTTTIAPADEYAMRLAVNQIRPLTSLITVQPGAQTTVRQEVNGVFTAASQVEVLRYVTGRASVQWPALDSTHWIQAGAEHEAPRALNNNTQHYQGFHNVASVMAYTEAALQDTHYGTNPAALVAPYWDTLIGTFSQAQQTILPGLQQFANPDAQYSPMNSLAPQPEPLIITSVAGRSIINGIYPIDYYSLPGVQQPTKTMMWASMERTDGIDYLEIDLGTVQAVNYLYFEASSSPYSIDVAYDTLDQAPSRNFRPVTLTPGATNTTTISYVHGATNLWQTIELNFGNPYGGLLYTRFLRIGFTRTPVGTVFAPLGQPTIPYSVEVRNLRVGRNVSSLGGALPNAVK
jgi:hypothetical protein